MGIEEFYEKVSVLQNTHMKSTKLVHAGTLHFIKLLADKKLFAPDLSQEILSLHIDFKNLARMKDPKERYTEAQGKLQIRVNEKVRSIRERMQVIHGELSQLAAKLRKLQEQEKLMRELLEEPLKNAKPTEFIGKANIFRLKLSNDFIQFFEVMAQHYHNFEIQITRFLAEAEQQGGIDGERKRQLVQMIEIAERTLHGVIVDAEKEAHMQQRFRILDVVVMQRLLETIRASGKIQLPRSRK